MPRSASRLLIVDDNEDARTTLSELLEASGYVVAHVASGREALEHIERDRPDLLLLDLSMPGMTGFEVAERLRAMPATRDLPIMAITAFTDPDVHLKGVLAGCDAVLVKPIEPSLLNERVERHLALRRGSSKPGRGAHRTRARRAD